MDKYLLVGFSNRTVLVDGCFQGVGERVMRGSCLKLGKMNR